MQVQRCPWCLALILPLFVGRVGGETSTSMEYPSRVAAIYGLNDTCWEGMDPCGVYPVVVDPNAWLVGPPPSGRSGVALPRDYWVDLGFAGPIVDGDGNDIVITELGRAGETALVLVTDGIGRAFPLGTAQALSTGGELPSDIGFDLAGRSIPFEPRTVRVVSLSEGGQLPGFDLGCVLARIRHDGPPSCARSPRPAQGATAVHPQVELSWNRVGGAGYVVYLGTDPGHLMRISPPGTPQEANRIDVGTLPLGQECVWQVHAVDPNDPNHPCLGPLWTFTVSDHRVVDDFESYPAGRTQGHWSVTAGTSHNLTIASGPEGTHTGCRALSLEFGSDQGSSTMVSRLFDPPEDWTAQPGASHLTCWIRGDTANPESMRLALRLEDSNGVLESLPYPSPEGLRRGDWQRWDIPLSRYTRLDLSAVRWLDLEVTHAGEHLPSWMVGRMAVDGLVLSSIRGPEPGDLNLDQTVDAADLALLAAQWLACGPCTVPIRDCGDPLVRFSFDGHAADSQSRAAAFTKGSPTYSQGIDGLAIEMNGSTDSIAILNASEVFSQTTKGLTIAFWQSGRDSIHGLDNLCCSDFRLGTDAPALAIQIGCWGRPGTFDWICGLGLSTTDWLSSHHEMSAEWMGTWNHWAFTKDYATGRLQVYLNGVVVASQAGRPGRLPSIREFTIGSGWLGGYDGLLDDLRIYGHALARAEVASLATRGTGRIESSLGLRQDLNRDGRVDLIDLAILAGH